MQVRDPCQWALAMKKNPWALCPPNDPAQCKKEARPLFGVTQLSSNFTTADFFQMPWKDEAELRATDWTTDSLYDNVFALRAHKLRLLHQIQQYLTSTRTEPRIQVVHLRDLEASPTRVIEEMVASYGIPIQATSAKPQESVLHFSPCLTSEERKIAQQAIDWEMEARFGYYPFDCHTCHGNYVRTSIRSKNIL